MKTKITSILILFTTLLTKAAIQYIDYSTVQTPQPYTNLLNMTIPGVTTNNSVTIITTNSIVGDSLPLAAAKINGDFDWLNTNGTTANSTLTGVIAGPTTNNYFSSAGSNYILSIAAYPSTNMVTDSNLTVIGDSWLDASNLLIYDIPQVVFSTNDLPPSPITGLIPEMTANNAPSGFASSSHESGGNFGWYAFNTAGYAWSPDASGNGWIQYQFDSPMTVNAESGTFATLTTTNVNMQASMDGQNWTTVWSVNLPYANTFSSVQFPSVTARFFKWSFSDIGEVADVNLYFTPQTQNIVTNTGTSSMRIDSLFGIGIDANANPLYALNINGAEDVSSLTVDGSTTTPNLITQDISDSGNMDAISYSIAGQPINFSAISGLTNSVIQNYQIANCIGAATNYNGLYTFCSNSIGSVGGATVWTNNTSGWVLYINKIGASGQTNYYVSSLVTNAMNVVNGYGITGIPFFTKTGSPLGQWPYNNNQFGPNFDQPYYVYGNMPYGSAVVTTAPIIYTGTFNGTHNGNGAGLTNLVSVIQQGTTNASALTSFLATFTQAFPDTNYTAIATGNGLALSAEYVSNKTTTNCLFNFGLATGSIDWLAVHR